MEIIHKTVFVSDNRRISITVPDTVPLGDAEVVLVVSSRQHIAALSAQAATGSHASSSSALKDEALSKLAELMSDKIFDHAQQSADSAAEIVEEAEAASTGKDNI